MNEGNFERDGVKLHYLEWNGDESSRPAVLLLHGLSSNAAFWSRTAALLPRRRMVALDQRAHGSSSAPAAGYDPAILAADAAALVERLGLGRVAVAGHSWGASIALQLAADRPDLVAGLAIIDGPVRPWSELGMTWEQAARVLQPPLPKYPALEDAIEEKRRFLRESWGDDLAGFVRSGLVADGTGLRLPLTAPIRLEILRSMFFQPYDVLWAQVRCPVLLALADGDSGPFLDSKRRSAQVISEQVPGTVVHWHRSGHDIPIHLPGAIAEEITRLCLRAGLADVTAEIAGLEGDWQAPTGYQDWTAKDLLAHLSSSQAALPAISRSRPTAVEPGEPFDSGRWNASQVRRRKETPAADLKLELESAGVEMDRLLAELSVSEPVAAGTHAGLVAGDALQKMVEHQRDHLSELRRTLGSPASSP